MEADRFVRTKNLDVAVVTNKIHIKQHNECGNEKRVVLKSNIVCYQLLN